MYLYCVALLAAELREVVSNKVKANAHKHKAMTVLIKSTTAIGRRKEMSPANPLRITKAVDSQPISN